MKTEVLFWHDGSTPRRGEQVSDGDGNVLVFADWPADPSKVSRLSPKEISELFPEPKSPANDNGKTAPPVAAPTAAGVAKEFAAATLKAKAKEMGLVTTGGEVAVAQRLLDAGWTPDSGKKSN